MSIEHAPKRGDGWQRGDGTEATVCSLPAEGFVREKQIIGPNRPIPIARSTWWKWIREGRAPKPCKLGPRQNVWPVWQIRELIAKLEAEGEAA